MALSRANCALKENACTAGYIKHGLTFSPNTLDRMASCHVLYRFSAVAFIITKALYFKELSQGKIWCNLSCIVQSSGLERGDLTQGFIQISCDGDNRMWGKNQTQKISRAANKLQKNVGKIGGNCTTVPGADYLEPPYVLYP